MASPRHNPARTTRYTHRMPIGCPSDAYRTAWLSGPNLVQANTVVKRSAGLAHSVEAGHRCHVENAVGGCGRRTDGMDQIDRTQDFLLPARGEDVERAAAGAEINLAVGD